MGYQSWPRDPAVLPDAYREYRTVDLKDKKFTVAVQIIFGVVVLVAVGVALLLGLPLRSSWSPILTIPVTLAACLIYMAAHEATHGVVLQALTKVKPSYALRFPFLTTGSRAYLTRRSAVIIAIAPAVIWGLVLLAALLTLPQDFLLTTYILLALNFAGSAGDLVEVYVVSRQPSDALVQDDGNKVLVFVPLDSR
ncbi:DUF3267 domain-containing protein [Arthrobacter sp. AQ5-05]|uniref:DUF3267 domain-containing protein n=1 Tax=Arthrobacter sp. AQ5-05 TaxID=2184581 RepID=UPI000DCEC37A|nr:DUF3267 domain-containing protein [Arthrobacter sp. AQ5-05]RAX47765.1 DUF3267 domain-containing protein [Arthrobacter sp. AQ5-05]